MNSVLLSSISRAGTAGINTSETESDRANRIVSAARAALLVGLSYYIGTRIGFVWTPSGQPNSTFWPPNAILLAALVLAPRKAWWTFVLAALPAHMLAQLHTGVPISTAIGWYITNCSEALIGAYCITRFTDLPKSFDTVRGVLIFVISGVLFSPLATSFLDAAAVVVTGWGRHYWPLGMERFWTNALAELTIVPIIVLGAGRGRYWIRSTSVARLYEGVVLAIATAVVAYLVFGYPRWSPGSIPALVYLPLPLLLWAAARFGLAGLSLSLLSLALISTWYTMHGRVPFPYASLPENILSLQILFCVVAVPLMFLSATMADARRTQESLRRMSNSLIQAQEQERHRIARELHDDINQRLAMLAVDLQQLQDNPSALENSVPELRKQVAEISNDLQALSHDLHASKLEYLGVVAGMRSWCKEASERQKIDIDFRSDVAGVLPLEIGIPLFRILQEALHNTVKHSGVKRLQVELTENAHDIHLVISDLGKGFDIEAAILGKGLGLTSMRERVRLINGTISIKSKPARGATIHVRVPLDSAYVANQKAV